MVLTCAVINKDGPPEILLQLPAGGHCWYCSEEYPRRSYLAGLERPLSVGMVGADISGLYSALLLQHYIPNVTVKLFEGKDTVGGRIFTYKFSEEPYQYCGAGPMRIPDPTDNPSCVIQLVKYLN